MVAACKGGNNFRATSAFTRLCNKSLAGRDKKEHQSNDRGARSSSSSSLHNSRCHAESTIRAWLQDKSIRITHNLAVFGGCGLVLSIITGLFGVNLDGIPGGSSTPYAFGLFPATVFLTGAILIGLGMLYLGLRRPVTEEEINVRKLELQDLVKAFQLVADLLAHDADYILIEQ